MERTYDESLFIIDINCFPSKRTSYTLPLGIFEISDINKRLEHLLPDILKVSVTIDDIRLVSNLKSNNTLIFTKSCLYCIRFFEAHSGPLNNFKEFIRRIPAE